MKLDDFRQAGGRAPVIVGTGLIALDIIVTDRQGIEPQYLTGGTCGNVLSILAFFGWQSLPIGTLGDDRAAVQISKDMSGFGVELQFLRRNRTRRTPIIVEKIRSLGIGAPRHRFLWTCPNCGSWLPGYQAITAKDAREIAIQIPRPAVFFFDRVSRGALELARACAEQGAVIVFEPSSIRNERLFREATALSHIVKYSHERLDHLREVPRLDHPAIEVMTLGIDGLRYRLGDGFGASSGWKEMKAIPTSDLRDTAGAGDWCTAGLIHALAKNGSSGFTEIGHSEIEEGLMFGQALASIKCRYEGARGLMYTSFTAEKLQTAVTELLSGSMPTITEDINDQVLGEHLKSICPNCGSEN